jgi:hypothetical protein
MDMAGRPKGLPKSGGRIKGTPNKITASVRECFEEAFRYMQTSDSANLQTWGEANPTEFYKLAAKLIPTDLRIQGDMNVTVITGVPE